MNLIRIVLTLLPYLAAWLILDALASHTPPTDGQTPPAP